MLTFVVSQYFYKKMVKEKDSREAAIKRELLILEKMVLKLGNEYTSALSRSMNLFKDLHFRYRYNY